MAATDGVTFLGGYCGHDLQEISTILQKNCHPIYWVNVFPLYLIAHIYLFLTTNTKNRFTKPGYISK